MREVITRSLGVVLPMVVWSSLAAAMPPEKVALQGARIIPVVGDDVDKGTLLIEHGVIKAIGTDVDIPYDAMVVDVSGKVLFPGMIDAHSARGLDIRNENLPVTPYLDVYDAIDPSRRYFEDALRDGITTIHAIVANDCVIGGLSRAVHPIGRTPDEMTLYGPIALKISVAPKRGFDRMVQMATLREAFLKLADYLDDLAETKYEESLKKEDKKIDVGPEEARKRGEKLIEFSDLDDAHRNLVLLTGGKLRAFIYCERPSDIERARQVADEAGFLQQSTFVLGPACFKAAAAIKSLGRPVVLDAQLLYRERDSVTAKLTETFVPKVYYDKGVTFSLLPSPDSSLAERYPNYQAARCVRQGLPRQTALEAITINPANAIGVADRVGSLEVGKVANVVVLSGDPLDFNAHVELVYINGIRAYDRQHDPRLEQLLEEEPSEVEDSGGGGSEGDAKEGDAKRDAGDQAGESKEGDGAQESEESSDEEPSDGDAPEAPGIGAGRPTTGSKGS
ncbi:MAG: amidohydrolase family protein [Phycisphaerae bacterium]